MYNVNLACFAKKLDKNEEKKTISLTSSAAIPKRITGEVKKQPCYLQLVSERSGSGPEL